MKNTNTIISLSSILFLNAFIAPISASQSPTPNSASVTSKPKDISSAVGLSEIKLQMAETRYKLIKDRKTATDLVNALEEFLNTNCMGTLLKTFKYEGNPSDPNCIARMTSLLAIIPDNPVAVCVRDGIAAQTCISAYQNQKVITLADVSSDEPLDPAMRVGLSGPVIDKIAKIEESLVAIDSKYKEATEAEEKSALIVDATNLYEQALNLACSLTTVNLVESQALDAQDNNSESDEINQTRQRLLQIPDGIRKDYQVDLEKKTLEEFNNASTSDQRKRELTELLKVIRDPESISAKPMGKMERYRVILDKCSSLLNSAVRSIPELPSITCYRDGWHTPQCIVALQRWRIKQQRELEPKDRGNGKSSNKNSIISTF